MKTFSQKSELIEKLTNLKGHVVVIENQVGFSPKGSPLYYWFFEDTKGVMRTDYVWSQSNGKKSYSFTRFWNFLSKNNLYQS
jgi:hypothetical protein